MTRLKATMVVLALGALPIAAHAFDVGVAASRSADRADAPDRRPGNFGSATNYYTAIDSSAMAPYQSGFIWDRSVSTAGMICDAASTDSRAIGQIHLPHGTRLEVLRVWAGDSSAEDVSVTLDRVCQPDLGPSVGDPLVEQIGNVATSGTPGQFSDSVSISGTVDNQSCTYRVIAQFDTATNSCSGGQFLLFYKARVQWQRQITPAPVTATFSDVPVGSQFHAEVEALVESGITQGCLPGQYCPGNFVTRLQMAAFLARALGLQWESIPDPANP